MQHVSEGMKKVMELTLKMLDNYSNEEIEGIFTDLYDGATEEIQEAADDAMADFYHVEEPAYPGEDDAFQRDANIIGIKAMCNAMMDQ